MKDVPLTSQEVILSRLRFEEAVHLQKMEGNPLSDEDLAMFEMFDRERWSHERCSQYILDSIKTKARERPTAAE